MSPLPTFRLEVLIHIILINSLIQLASGAPADQQTQPKATGETGQTQAELTASARQKASQLSQAEVERLDRMFKQSSEVATNGLYELNILKHLGNHFRQRLTNGAATAADSLEQLEPEPGKVTVHLDGKAGERERQYAIHAGERQGAVPLPGAPAAGSENYNDPQKRPAKQATESRLDESILKLLHIVEPGAHSEARQAGGLFSGFRLPTTPALPAAMTSNPLMSGLLRPPSLPAFQFPAALGPFSQQQQQLQPIAPRPPKSSIIGGGSGAMALTNDNVVVVNVLSGNY